MASLTRMVVIVMLLFTGACQTGGKGAQVNKGTVDGLSYEVSGTGPLIVLIHGSNLDRRMWDNEVLWLRKHAKVLRYDMRGQGASETPNNPYSNHGDLIGLLDSLKQENADLIGISSGAQVALDVALQAPDKVRRLVLVSPSLSGYQPEEYPPYLAELFGALKSGDYTGANEILLASPIMNVPEARKAQVRGMIEENARLWSIPYSLVQQVSPPAIERLEQIRAPTLVLVGENDVQAVRTQGELLDSGIPSSELVRIPDGGHLLNMTSPEAFREQVSGFLEL